MTGMEPVGLDDILGRERYGAERDAIRARVIVHKRSRRVQVGDRLTFVFEDRATIWYQTQEMVWVEQITDLDSIREEMAVYNELLPGAGEFSATLLIGIEDQTRVKEELHHLIGIDEHVILEVGPDRIPARFEEGRKTSERISAVQYVRFPLGAGPRRRLESGEPLAIAVAHPNYRVRAEIPPPVRSSLAAEMTDPAAATRAFRQVRDGA